MLNLSLLLGNVAALLWVCWAAGVLVDRALGLRCPWWFRIGTGQAALGTLWTWAIIAGIFRPPLVAATLVLCVALGTFIARANRAAAGARGTAIGTRRGPQAGRRTNVQHTPNVRANALEHALFFLFFAMAVLLACYPYQGSDFLSYQLPMAQGYAETGGWLWFDHLRFPTFPPLMNGWFAVALMLGGRWQIPLAQLSALLPMFVLCALLARLVRDAEPGARGAWGVALFLGSPAVAWAAVHSYVDGAMSLFMIMATWCVLRFHQAGGYAPDGAFTLRHIRGSRWSWLLLAGALVGAAMNTKYLGAAFVPLLGTWLLLRWWHEGPGRRLISLLGAGLAFGGSAFLVAAPWYLITWIRTGNPVFPFARAVFGWNPWGWSLEPIAQVQARPAELFVSPLRWDGLSPWLLLTTGLVLWVWLRREQRIASSRGLLLLVGTGYLALWFVMPDDRRYLLPSLALLSATGASAVGMVSRRLPILARSAIGHAAVTGLLLLLGLAFLADQVREQGGPPPGPDDAAYIEREVPGSAALAWAEKHLEPRRIYVPSLEGVRSFARTSTVVGDWSGPWSRLRLLAGVRSPDDLLRRLDDNQIDALIDRPCRVGLRRHKIRIDRWIREGRVPRGGLDFGVRTATPPFDASMKEVQDLPDLRRRDIDQLLEDALAVVHRDGDVCVLVPRRPPAPQAAAARAPAAPDASRPAR